jgi:hypothetical protein
MRRLRRPLVAIPLAAAIAGGCGTAGASSAGPGAASVHAAATGNGNGATALLTIGRPTSSPPVAPGFVGISTTFSAMPGEAGSDPAAIDPVFVQLLKNLAPGQQPVIRIGGDSTDWTWWPVAHLRRPPGIRYTLGKSWLAIAKGLARAAGARLILGVNLEANSRRVAATEAQELISGIGSSSIEALELGNEPELYSAFAWYHTKSGAKVLGRPASSWTMASYFHDYSSVADALPHLPLAGPSVGGPLWITGLPQFLRDEPRVRLATIHAYPLKVCAPGAHTSIPALLATSSSAGLASTLVPAVRAAHSHGVPLRLDEMNAVSCGGQAGVSNSFATALWSADFLFELAKIGVSGVNVNSIAGSINSPFSFSHSASGWSASVHPLYYGMQLFSAAAPADSRLLSVSGHAGSDLRAWATRATNGVVHVLLINDALSQATRVTLRLPGSGSAPAALQELRAAHVSATSGVTLGGLSYGASTTTGVLAGKSGAAVIRPSHNGYSVRIPPATAALLTLG